MTVSVTNVLLSILHFDKTYALSQIILQSILDKSATDGREKTYCLLIISAENLFADIYISDVAFSI